jgi:CHAT domain-containing protein
MWPLRPTLLLVLAWAGLAVPASVLAAATSSEFARCEQQFFSHPERRDSARCFFIEVSKGGDREEAERRLQVLLASHPRNPGIQLYAAILDLSRQEQAERLLRSAAGAFLHDDPAGEFLARYNLVELLLDQGRSDEAGAEIERETSAARASGGPAHARYLALAEISRARYLANRGDFKQADLLLGKIPPGQFRDERWLEVANTVHTETGQLDRSWDECLQLSRPSLDHSTRAAGLYCKARVLVERTAEVPDEAARRLIENAAKEAIVEADAAGNRMISARAHWLLAMSSGGGEPARAELLRCLHVASGGTERRLCLGALARYMASKGRVPRELEGDVHGLGLDDPVFRAQSYGDQMRVSWRTRSFPEFVRAAEAALAEIERLRARQASSDVQSGLFSTWSADYYWFAGRLLEAGLLGRCPDCMALAFGVMERLRGRTLYDILVVAGADTSAAPADGVQLVALRQAIERVTKRRQDDALPPSERENANRDLRALSLEEERSRLASPSARATAPVVASPGFATMAGVQRILAPDEAMLSFQVAPWLDWTGDFGGGSWLLVATKHAMRCYRLGEMGRGDLRRGVADFFEHRSRSRAWQAAELYRQLLGPALAELPPGIERLIVVPDDHLHRLPFGALRATPGGKPIAWRYQISIAPSATLWANWRTARPPRPAERPALVLADPPPPTEAVQRAFQAEGIRLPAEPLPAARREADALVRSLGWGCERRVGGEVSASALLDSRLSPRRFALVHFAAHSIVDERDPRRSGIWLSPAQGHDGLVKAGEIAKLRFDDRVVVLSTCSSNGGPFLRGEGVLSLAHAFFQARARTVVASLWPQLDTDEEALFTAFYRHLGKGASVAAALRLAQLDRLRQDPNLPPVAWAGMVVLGDGDFVPFPGGRHPGPPRWVVVAGVLTAAAVAILALVAVLGLARRSRLARRGPDP